MEHLFTKRQYATHYCIHCGKSYKIKSNLDKHIYFCELMHRVKKTGVQIEDDEELPSSRKMFQMLLDLGEKYNKLEEKLNEIDKFVVRKKKKINVLEWLNGNILPNLVFKHLHETIVIIDSDIEFLLENSFLETINTILSRTIYKTELDTDIKMPMFAFVQKPNIFYIFDKNENDTENGVWAELPKDKLALFLMRVQMKISKAFCEWKKQRNNAICDDERFAILCDKTIVKIMGTEFREDKTFHKMKSIIYNNMKADMKALIEYEFEF